MKEIIKQITFDNLNDIFDLENKLLGLSSIETLKSNLNNPNIFYYGLFFDEKLVGFFEISMIVPEIEIYSIAVNEKYAHQGYATKLMNYLIIFAKNNKCKTIFLEVNTINSKAIGLYEKFNFIKCGLRKHYYKNGDAILMKLDL